VSDTFKVSDTLSTKARLILCAALVAVFVVPSATAKEGAQAHLLRPLPDSAAPGSFVTVRWSVDVPGPHGTRVPFGADGMFVRVTGKSGASIRAYTLHAGPPFEARVRVPAGGIRAVRFGLMGTACDASGCRASPMWFPLTRG
jgi:hypothetical protein